MKPEIHPEYKETQVTCGCGEKFVTRSTVASDVFRGGIVSYASDVKFDVLGVTPGPVVSETAAKEMAVGVRKALGSDIGLSLTGVAGPAEQDGVKVGTVCVGIAFSDGTTKSTTFHLPIGREQMRQLSEITALNFLRNQLR